MNPYPQGNFQIDVRGVNGRVVADDSGPTATGPAPKRDSRVRGTFTSTIGGVTDGAGVARAELWVNGKHVGSDTTAPYALAVRTGTANGTLTFNVQRIGLSRGRCGTG